MNSTGPHSLPDPAPGSNSVTRLVPRDRLHMDPGPIVRLYSELGEAAAEEVICRALDDLIRRINALTEDHRACAFDRMAVTLRRITAVADQLGQLEIAAVAADVSLCTQTGDANALAATLARLGRICERAVNDIWAARHGTR